MGKTDPVSAAIQRATRTRDLWQRRAAIEALATFHGSRVVAVLRRLLADEEGDARATAAAVLGSIGAQEAVDDLVAALEDDHWLCRQNSAKALGVLGAASAAPTLVRQLSVERDGYAEAALIEALGAIGRDIVEADEVVPALLAHAKRYPRRVEKALVAIGPRVVILLVGLLDPRAVVSCCVAVRSLGRCNLPSAAKPIRRLWQRSRRPVIRRTCAHALHALGYQPDDDALAQWMSLAVGDWAALEQRGAAAEPTLLAALRDDSSAVRWRAASLLQVVGTEQALPALMRAQRTDSDGEAAAIVRALEGITARMGSAASNRDLAAHLHRLVKSLDWRRTLVQVAALDAMATAAHPSSLPVLAAYARSNVSALRVAALRSLRSYAPADAEAILLQALAHEDTATRQAAASTLEALACTPDIPSDQVRAYLARGAAEAVVARIEDYTPALIAMLTCEPPRHQAAVARVLASSALPEAEAALLGWLAANATLIGSEHELALWEACMASLWGTITRVVLQACAFATMTRRVVWDGASSSEDAFDWDIQASQHAVEALCAIDSPASTRALQAIAGKADARVATGYSENEWGGGESFGELSFAAQREAAAAALRRRQGPGGAVTP